MTRRWRIAIGLAGLAAVVAGARAVAQDDVDARARAIHQRILAIDSHADVLLPGTPPQYFAPGGTSRTDLDKLRRGGIGAVALAIAVGPGPRTPEGVADARKEADAKLAAIRAFVEAHASEVELALSADDLVRIHTAGKVAILESFLNARSIGRDVSAIDALYRNGVRVFGFTHAGHNDFADSSRPTGEPAEEHRGLSQLGKDAVSRLNRLGVIIDVSQLTPAGVLQVLELSKAPVIASHSNVRALVDNGRNLSDRELDAIKANGGVVHITPFNAYLKVPPPAGSPAPKAALGDYVDHIDYVVRRIGVDHVGISSDFDGGGGIDGWNDAAETFNVTLELVKRGYTEEQIARIWSGNLLRVWEQVEQVARGIQAGTIR